MKTNLTSEELKEAFEYLDELRASCRTNMWAAANFLHKEELWPIKEADEAFLLWKATFDPAIALDDRVATAKNKEAD